MMRLNFKALAFAAVALLMALPLVSQAQPVAETEISEAGIIWHPVVETAGIDLRIAAPMAVIERFFKAGKSPFFDFFDAKGNPIGDGLYTYELSAVPPKGPVDERFAYKQTETMTQSGSFRIVRGRIVNQEQREETAKDFVINDDLIVDGSACIGFDCVNGEVFSFDTLRLKENNLRIKFDDTSTTSSFPRNDWQLTANESANGGLSKFSIEDISGGRTPFTIEANAPSHSLYVDDGGRIGIRTSTPSVELHVIDGDTPTLRLQQDGSSGFTPQTWDVAGNETNFFVRDVTNGSSLPFRIRPGAPSSAIFIDVDGDVGLGTSSPDSTLDIEDITPELRLTSTGAGEQWEIRMNNAGNLNFQAQSSGNNVMQLDPEANDNLFQLGINAANRIDITGSLFINGVDNSTPDYVFSPSYALESIEEHAAFMWHNKHLPAVAPAQTNSNGETSFEIGARSQGALEELEKAHIYIEQLHHKIKGLDNNNKSLHAANRRLEQQLAAIRDAQKAHQTGVEQRLKQLEQRLNN